MSKQNIIYKRTDVQNRILDLEEKYMTCLENILLQECLLKI